MNFLKSNKVSFGTLDILDGWHTYDEFWEILKKEQNRSDRTGLPFSHIQINISQNAIKQNKISGRDFKGFIKKFADIISNNTRNYDMKFFVNPYTIGILLIDTSLDGAKLFIEKISHALCEYFKSIKKPHYMDILQSVTISSHPPTQIPYGDNQDTPPIVMKSLKFEDKIHTGFNNKLYFNNSAFSFDWDNINLSGNTIALNYPLLWDLAYKHQTQISYRFWKRAIDIFGAILGIILFSPMALLICLGIKLTSKGPILFKQTRIGHLHKPFTFLKFRTMKYNSEDKIHQEYVKKLIEGKDESLNQGNEGKPIYKLNSDPRVTWIGQYLRKISLDEIPQLFHVLKGDMSLVGPRPPIDYEVERYKSWHLRRIVEAKPGITGLWQVSGRSKTTFDEMVRLDLQYVEKQSILLDIKIILFTFIAMFKTDEAH